MKKGQVVGTARWHSWTHKQQEEEKEWTSEFMTALYYGMCTGEVDHLWEVFDDAAARFEGKKARVVKKG